MIKLFLLLLSGAKLGKLFASGGGLPAAPQFVKAWKYDPKAPENQSYYAIAPERRFQFLALYFGLAAYLAFMTFRTHELISPAAP